MKIAIIGAGNMGGAIARGLAAKGLQLSVSNASVGKLDALKSEFSEIEVTTDNCQCAQNADIVFLAVKPRILPGVIDDIKSSLDYTRQTIVSLAGGISLDTLDFLLSVGESLPAVMHVIPTTGALVGRSMTFMASRRADKVLVDTVSDLLGVLGEVAVVDENLMNAGTALCSCGIAYIYKYIQACVQAGVQLGFRPADALKYTIATAHGALALLDRDGATPQGEIDRVTTPGGMTIKGINQLDHAGFTSAVIQAILKPVQQ